MNNNFINNNGANLLHTKKSPKTKVESQIEILKQQEQKNITELERWETKSKKVDKLLTYLAEVDKFSSAFLTEAVKIERDHENSDDYRLEHLIKNRVEFSLKFEAGSKAFYQLICQKTEGQVSYLKSQLRGVQSQLSHQERIFARLEIRRQGRILLKCKLGYRLGCPGVYQCDNCKVNYSVVADNHQITEISK